MTNKYITVSVSGIILNISKSTEFEGYTDSVISVHIPESTEIMTPKQQKAWVTQNNYRMKAICKFMNENNL